MRKFIFFILILIIPLGAVAQCLGGDCPKSSKYNKNTKQKSEKNFNFFGLFSKKNTKRKSKDRNFNSKVATKPKKHKIKAPIPDANPDGIWAPGSMN